MLKRDKLDKEIELVVSVISLELVFFFCACDKSLGCSPNMKVYESQIESNFSVT